MAKQTRVRTLPSGASTASGTFDAGKFQLGVGKLTQISITSALAAAGPVLANAGVEFDNNLSNRLSLGSPKWIRADSTFGQREAWHWEGDIEVDRDDNIWFAVRNDSGASFVWVGGWVIV